ncbi:hypothetical protein FBU30_007224 [Linnemannia zychae]|nr:hypothetical protein FBU30_007224 [Linnemannia zychae]
MRYSTTTALIAISSLALLACSTFQNTLVSARLTPEERRETEARDPTNPNYCPDCLKKALVNHFPHACPNDIQPMVAVMRPTGPTPEERRCVCIAFLDLKWMKSDCSEECAFVKNLDAMAYILNSKAVDGCEQYVDFDTNTEREMEGFAKKDPNHVPETYDQVTTDEADGEIAEADEEESTKERKPSISIKMENFIRNPDGSIPEYALKEMAAEKEAKEKAEREAAEAAEAEANANAAGAKSETKASEAESSPRDEL